MVRDIVIYVHKLKDKWEEKNMQTTLEHILWFSQYDYEHRMQMTR